MNLPAGYALRQGSSLDRALLVKFMRLTYREMEPEGKFAHLAQTVDQYLSQETPLWWVALENSALSQAAMPQRSQPVACLWLGTAIDQVRGDRHLHIFLLYVLPEHRRQGIGTALMHQAEDLARARGDHQLGLQVFASNQVAVRLYRSLGFQTQSLWMIKPLQ